MTEQNPNTQTPENGDDGQQGDQKSTIDKAVETGSKVQALQSLGQAAVHGVGAILGFLFNPVTLIIVVIFLAAVGGYSTMQVIGQNENACFAQTSDDSGDGSGGGGGSSSTAADQQKIANIIGTWVMSYKFNFLGGKPMNKYQAAAVVGNAMQESTLNPKAVNPQSNATGLWQWLLVNELKATASDMNSSWDDVGVQLTYLARTLNTTEKNAFKIYGQPEGRVFLDTSSTDVAALTNAWAWSYERMGKSEANVGNRIKAAEDFLKYYKEVPESEMPKIGDTWDSKFTGGAGGGNPAAADEAAAEAAVPAACDEGNFNNGSIVETAIGLAWPKDQRANALVSGMADGGRSRATPAYVSAKTQVEKETDKDPMDLWADCGRFVATVMRTTVDKKFPWGPTRTQYDYLKSNSNLYQDVGTKKSDAKPGDIFIVGGEGGSGHIALYLGQHEGIDAVADASMAERTGLIGSSSFYKDNMVSLDGRQFHIFRYIGPGAGSGDLGIPPGVTHGKGGFPTSVPKVTGSYQGKDVAKIVKEASKYPNAKLPSSILCTAGGATLRCDAAKKFSEWNAEYRKVYGSNIPVNTSYRDLAYQIRLYKKQPELTAPPGTSNHGWGLAVDIDVDGYGPRQQWLAKNGPKYGWQWPAKMRPGGSGPDEPWHFEFGNVS